MVKIITKELIKSDFETDKLVSCSLFRQLKIDLFKSPIKYYNWLRGFVKNINKVFPDFLIRVYTDLSLTYNANGSIYNEGIKLLKELKRNPKVEVLMYQCEDFSLNKYYHDGTFGSFIRFMPIFEKNKYKLVWSSDLDQNEIQIKNTRKWYDNFEKTNTKFWVYSFKCYLNPWVLQDNKFNIFAGWMMSKVKFPKKLLTNFLNNIKKGKYNEIINKISKNKRTLNKTTLMPYGIDEFFLNKYVYAYLMDHKIKTFVINDINVSKIVTKLLYSKQSIYTKKELENMKYLYFKYVDEKNDKKKILMFDKLKNDYILLSNKVLKNQKKLIKDNSGIDIRYFNDCPKQFLDNLHKIKSSNLTYTSIVEF